VHCRAFTPEVVPSEPKISTRKSLPRSGPGRELNVVFRFGRRLAISRTGSCLLGCPAGSSCLRFPSLVPKGRSQPHQEALEGALTSGMNSQQGTLRKRSWRGWLLIFGNKLGLGSACPAGHPQGILVASGGQPPAYECENEASRVNPGSSRRGELLTFHRNKKRREFPAGRALRSEFLVSIFGPKGMTSEVNARQCTLQGSLAWLAATLRRKRKIPQE